MFQNSGPLVSPLKTDGQRTKFPMPTLLASEWVKARISKSWYIDTSHRRAEHVAGVNHSDLTHLGNGRQVKQNKKNSYSFGVFLAKP